MTKKCILIDSYGFIFRAYHVQPKLTSPDGLPVGAVYGFISILIKLLQDHNPSHIAAVFDSGGKNFRHEIFPEYKAHRPDVPEDLIAQFGVIREVVKSLNIASLELNGYEADDLIASLAKSIESTGEEVIIVSADKDLAQLMSDKIKIFDPTKTKFISKEDIFEKFGISEPEKILDILAITGDKSDNIPGVPGFGPKTAAELISQFGDFEGLLNGFENIQSDRKRETFRQNIEKAKLSYELAKLDSNIAINTSLADLAWDRPNLEQILNLLNRFGFKSLIARASKLAKSEPASQLSFMQYDQQSDNRTKEIAATSSDINNLLEECNSSCYLSLLISEEGIFAEANGKIFKFSNLEAISQILEDSRILKILFNIKYYHKKTTIKSYADIAIMAYILSSGEKQLGLNDLISSKLGIETSNPIEICSNLRNLYLQLNQALFDQKLLSLYIDIDYPISMILNKMENIGVKFDIQKLNQLSEEFGKEITGLEKKIWEISGAEFNVASPKQLGEILFNKLQIPYPIKNTKSDSYSTNVEILEELSSNGFEIANYLLRWRQISKLKNTYADAIPKLVNEKTGRIHTTMQQTSTTTGRLSSHEPNLQNIPIRTPDGERIRSSLIAEEGYKLISADYSQIELRILAEIADIKQLKEAFIQDQDIHSKTASEIFQIPIENVSSEQRRKAKAINFGIIYGISSFGLAKQLGIGRNEAKEYIEVYFQTYPGIKEYMNKTIEFARKNGYVVNYFNRKCFLPSINSSNHTLKNFSERAAINAPLQGLASDIVKIAMIEIDQMLIEKNLKTRVILQIHDELLFESPDSEVEMIAPLIIKIMENIVNFHSKLKVDIHISSFWS